MLVSVFGRFTPVSSLQPLKVSSGRAVSFAGSFTSTSALQFSNILSPIFASPICVMLSGKDAFLSDAQFSNTSLPICVTLLGTVMLCSPVFLNAPLPRVLMLLGRLTLVSFLQSINAPLPIVVTLLGIETDERALHPLKAPPSILTTPFSSTTFSIPVQFQNASSETVLTLPGIVTVPLMSVQ